MPQPHDPFKARTTLATPLGERTIYQLSALRGIGEIDTLPYSIKVLLEAVLRNQDGYVYTEDHVKALAGYDAKTIGDHDTEIPFMPGRVVLQDFTGVPAVVDLAAMREGIVRMTGNKEDATKVNPLVPCDLVIDHSVQVDAFAHGMALTINMEKEFERNNERYEFLKWGQQAFDNFRVVPPATGIVHQVNLEYLAKVVWEEEGAKGVGTKGQSKNASHSAPQPLSPSAPPALYPDSLVGTDSHTTMINGLGVVGWGVGGIEAEAVMLGQPIYMLIPEVVGVKLTGALKEGVTATDLVLRVTEMLRAHGVVGKFVEFHGPGLATMPLANRATIANMAPEYGATMGFFPVDEQTTEYLRLTGRDENLIETVRQYTQANGLWRNDDYAINYTDDLELDMSSVEPALAGPKRPQDRINLSDMQAKWKQTVASYDKSYVKTTLVHNPTGGWVNEGGQPEGQVGNQPQDQGGAAVAERPHPPHEPVTVEYDGHTFHLPDGAVCIAAITSCTNTSNPDVMLAAGLVAQKAHALGLNRKPWVKTSLAPGSKVVTEYYEKAGLTDDLDALGFNLVGYGCTTCIGNSGPLPEPISKAVNEHDLLACSVLSGNRNFEGRIGPDLKCNYLASPPLVVAYAIAGTVDIDLQNDPLAKDKDGHDVYLKDIWPTQQEVADLVRTCVTREQFTQQYADVFKGPDDWRSIDAATGNLYDWSDDSTYIQEPPFFEGLSADAPPIQPIEGARCLAKLGDSVTTDHISPAGAIKTGTPAADYLDQHGVPRSMYNSYGSRRGNDRVMTRGTFANVRVKNQLAPGTEGGFTVDFSGLPAQDGFSDLPDDCPTTGVGPSGGAPVRYIYDAVQNYKSSPNPQSTIQNQKSPGTPLVVLAGTDYGMGSSRDWAAKGTFLLNVKAVIAKSFERIHRSNLVGMGVLPLTFADGQDADSLGLDGTETFHVPLTDDVTPRQTLTVTATAPEGSGRDPITFDTRVRIDTPVEVDYYRNGGILHTVLRNMAKS
jgi:aconitate hydratase